MKISDVARETGVAAKTIRYYESIELIPPAARQSNGYRAYREADVSALRFISRARTLGFSLDEIRDLLALWQDKGRASADVKRLAVDHIRAIEQRISELETVKNTLIDLTHRCHGDDRPDCPILEDLARI